MADPALVPNLSVNRHILHEKTRITQPLRRNPQRIDLRRVWIRQLDTDIVEPWREQEIDRLGNDGVKPQHIPDHPAIDGAGVTVSGEAVRRVGVVLVDGLAGSQHGFVLPALEVVIQERCRETWFIARVKQSSPYAVRPVGAYGCGFDARDEHCVESVFGGGGPAHEVDEGVHVEGHGPTVFPGERFVGDGHPFAGTARGRIEIRGKAGTVGVFWGEEAGEV